MRQSKPVLYSGLVVDGTPKLGGSRRTALTLEDKGVTGEDEAVLEWKSLMI